MGEALENWKEIKAYKVFSDLVRAFKKHDPTWSKLEQSLTRR